MKMFFAMMLTCLSVAGCVATNQYGIGEPAQAQLDLDYPRGR